MQEGELKCGDLLGSHFSCYQLKIDSSKLFYVSIMVTTKQKPIVNTQKIKRKKYKHNTKESPQTTKEESKRRKEQKGTIKTARK